MVEMRLHLAAYAGKSHEMIQALQFLARQVQFDQQCPGCHVYAEVGIPEAICYVEDWLSTEDLDLQIRSDRFTHLLALMETAAEPPTLEFHFISETRGLDYVSEL